MPNISPSLQTAPPSGDRDSPDKDFSFHLIRCGPPKLRRSRGSSRASKKGLINEDATDLLWEIPQKFFDKVFDLPPGRRLYYRSATPDEIYENCVNMGSDSEDDSHDDHLDFLSTLDHGKLSDFVDIGENTTHFFKLWNDFVRPEVLPYMKVPQLLRVFIPKHINQLKDLQNDMQAFLMALFVRRLIDQSHMKEIMKFYYDEVRKFKS